MRNEVVDCFRRPDQPHKNARLPSCSLVLGATKSSSAAERRAARLETVETGMHSSFRRSLSALSRSGLLDTVKVSFSQCRSDGRLRLTASPFKNRFVPVCRQSWSHGTLLHRTRCFFPFRGGLNHRQYPLHSPTEEWPG